MKATGVRSRGAGAWCCGRTPGCDAAPPGREAIEGAAPAGGEGGRPLPDPGRSPGADRGGATICLLFGGLVFVLVGVFGAAIGAARLARHQARVAADFAALAAAGQVLRGDGPACLAADELASANRARLTSCRLDGLDALVTVEVPVTPLPGFHRVATATARAGPVRA